MPSDVPHSPDVQTIGEVTDAALDALIRLLVADVQRDGLGKSGEAERAEATARQKADEGRVSNP